MTQQAADLLITKIERERRWPPPFDHDSIGRVARFAAFREADEETLRNEASWKQGRQYVIDPIGDRIALAKADLLFGEDPVFRAKAESDQPNLDRIVEISDLPSELHYAEQLRSSEGEVWGRLQIDPTLVEAPMITFHSRESVLPLYVGSALVAAAFFEEFEDPASPSRERPRIWRHLEIHTQGRVENRLYKGYQDNLGEAQPLDAFAETEDLPVEWVHGLPGLLVDRIVFRRGRTRILGRSVYDGVEELMLALNEAMTIGVENARLTAKKRVVVPSDRVERRGPAGESIDAGDGSRVPVQRADFDAGEDVLVMGGLDATLGKEDAAKSLFQVLEYSFDSEALIAWQDKLVKTLASRCGLTVSFLGEGAAAGEGTAETGTALRVKLLPATSSARGSGRGWDDALPRLLLFAQLIDGMTGSEGGFARTYSSRGDAPSVEREDPLPRDEAEETQRHVTAVGGPVESVETAVKALHPDWTPEQIKAEVKAIREDVQTSNQLLGLGVPPGSPKEDKVPAPTPEPPG